MFNKSIDNKKKYTTNDGIEVVDLSEGIFDKQYTMSQVGEVYKVPKEFEMRPDLISKSLYGSTDYAEMVMKYSMISNPFAVERDDIIFGISLSSIYNPVKESLAEPTKTFDAVKNFHKYIDKDKVPSKPGSDTVTTVIKPQDNNGSNGSGNGEGGNKKQSGIEANISKTGNNGITVKDGKIYFGAIDESLSSVDSSIADCATNGMSLGEFLNATIRELA